MLNEDKIKKLVNGKINLDDLDRDADLMWAVADLYSIEKHLNIVIGNIIAKLKEGKDVEKNNKLLNLAMNLLNEVRIQRAKHLKKLYKLKEFGFWCIYKHLLGAMLQFGEVGSKEIYMGNMEEAKNCFETSEFCLESIMLLNNVAKEIKNLKDNGKSKHVKKNGKV